MPGEIDATWAPRLRRLVRLLLPAKVQDALPERWQRVVFAADANMAVMITDMNSVEQIVGTDSGIWVQGANGYDLDLTDVELINIAGIMGDATANTTTGSAGDDVIQGCEGNDTLNGGDGNDTFSNRRRRRWAAATNPSGRWR